MEDESVAVPLPYSYAGNPWPVFIEDGQPKVGGDRFAPAYYDYGIAGHCFRVVYIASYGPWSLP